MKIALIADHLPLAPWSIGPVIARLCRTLAQRGHTLTLLAQSIEDVEMFTPVADVQRFVPFEHGESEFPSGFERWVMAAMQQRVPEVSVSFSHRVAGNVWLPMSPTPSAWIADRLDNTGLARTGMILLKHPSTFTTLARQRTRGITNIHNVHRVLTFGPSAADQARRALARARLSERVLPIDPVSMLDDIDPQVIQDLRSRTQQALNLIGGSGPGQRRLIVLISAMGLIGRRRHTSWLDPILLAIARLNPGTSTNDTKSPLGPAAIITCREQFPVHDVALRTGSLAHVRIIGGTQHTLAPLAAADMIALPQPTHAGVFLAGARGRLAADALRLGRPLLALRSAAGADVAAYREPAGGRAGQILDPGADARATADVWKRALSTAMHAEWLVPASRAAQLRGSELTFDRLIDAIERAMHEIVG